MAESRVRMMIYHWRMIRVLLLSDDCGIDSVPNSYVKSVYTICNVNDERCDWLPSGLRGLVFKLVSHISFIASIPHKMKE